MIKKENEVYREIQQLQQTWLKVLVIIPTIFMWFMTIQQLLFKIPFGNQPMSDRELFYVWLIVGVILPVIILHYLKLKVEVRSDGLYVRLSPLHLRYKKIPFSTIESYQAVTYQPLKRFGGWGIRFNFKGERAYTLDGKRGVEVQTNTRTFVIGSRKPEELVQAISAIKNK